MIEASDFLTEAKLRGFELYSGVPCSYLRSFIDYVIDSDELRYVAAANEGDAVAIAAGGELGGMRSVCMFQNSGLGNAVSPLSSLTSTFKIPVLLIVTHRGEPGAKQDEPQHELMGRVTADMLELLGVPCEPFPTEVGDIDAVLERADRWMSDHSTPYALLMSAGSVAPWARTSVRPPEPTQTASVGARPSPSARRGDFLAALQDATGPSDVLVATTGYTGRELYSLEDRPNQLYVVGSMGCASSVGLGLAIARPHRRVVVIDGDGAALMRLGALSTIGAERPPNLVHVVLDNGQHESTGGQQTVADSTDLGAIAVACGYPEVHRVTAPEDLARTIAGQRSGCLFVHVPILAGTPDSLPRPDVTPPEVADRLRTHLAQPLPDRTRAGSQAPDSSEPARDRDRRMCILVVTDLDSAALDALRAEHDVIQSIDPEPDELRRLAADRQAIVFRSGVQITADLMRSAPDLELLIRAGSGMDNVDIDHADAAGIAVARIPEPGARAVAELAFGLMLSLARQVLRADGLLRKGRWAKHTITGHLLRGKTLGVYGAGNIGCQVGEMGAAWGMSVIGCVKEYSDERADALRRRGIQLVTTDEVLRRADFVVVTVPLCSENRYLIDAEAISAMRRGAFLINMARGGIVDERALVEALASGHLAGAGLDVHEHEGEGAISPLAQLPNVILTPHMGAGTVESRQMIGERVVEIVTAHRADVAR